MRSVTLVVWSDYLCPWCRVAAVRLRRVAEEFGPALRLEWRSFLLRPEPDPALTRERFVRYTRTWERAGAEPDMPPFRPWTGEGGPPSCSPPPHVVAKAAARLGPAAFEAIHERLLTAYFEESRDPTDFTTLAALWTEAGLPADAFAAAADPALLAQVLHEHRDGLARGVGGVPAAMLVGNDVVVPGALPLETYRRWIARALA